jgi:hypothetical protein
MRNGKKYLFMGGACVLLYLAVRNAQVASATSPAGDSAGLFSGVIDSVNSTVSNLTASVPDAVNNANVQAFLKLILTGEGTADAGAYKVSC